MSTKGKRVHFTNFVEVNIIDALDPKLKPDLFFSREEMQLIQERFKIENKLYVLRHRSKELQEKVKKNQIYVLRYQKEATPPQERKPSKRTRLLEGTGEPSHQEEPPTHTKRRQKVSLQPIK